MKILLPVDGSDYTKRMLAYLAAHDELLAGTHEYMLFTVIEPATMNDGSFLDLGSLEQILAERAKQILQTGQAFAQQQKWNYASDFVPGSAVQAIVAKAESFRADLIVMGTRGRSALGTFVLGSVANGVLAQCKVPVLLIR